MVEEYKKFLDEGIVKINLNKFNEAIEVINKSISLKGDWEISYFYRGVAYNMMEDYENAILDYTKAIKINPSMVDAYYNRAKILLEKKDENIDLDFIVNDLNKALELDENFIDALFAISCAYKKKEEYQKSLEYLEKLLKIQPESVNARALKKLLLQKYIK